MAPLLLSKARYYNIWGNFLLPFNTGVAGSKHSASIRVIQSASLGACLSGSDPFFGAPPGEVPGICQKLQGYESPALHKWASCSDYHISTRHSSGQCLGYNITQIGQCSMNIHSSVHPGCCSYLIFSLRMKVIAQQTKDFCVIFKIFCYIFFIRATSLEEIKSEFWSLRAFYCLGCMLPLLFYCTVKVGREGARLLNLAMKEEQNWDHALHIWIQVLD